MNRQRNIVLFTPGPTAVPPFVYEAMQQPLYHRSDAFRQLWQQLHQRLQWLFQTEQPVLALTCSATGAAEAVIQQLFASTAPHCVVVNGKFAERWAQMLERFGAQVHRLSVPWGEAPLLEEVESVVQSMPNLVSFWVVHSETSTGALSDVKAIARIVRTYSDALICVDAVSSLGVHPLPMDQWGLDVVFTGSQKSLMLPPGLAFVALSQRAWDRVQHRSAVSWYFDLLQARRSAEKGLTPWTPAIPLLQGADAVLQYFQNAGLEAIWHFHQRRAHAFRAALEALQLRVFGQSSSHAVTPVYLPPGGESFRQQLYEQFGIVVAGGQEQLKGKIFRVSHMGWLPYERHLYLISAMEQLLQHQHYHFEFGAGIATFQKAWMSEGANR